MLCFMKSLALAVAPLVLVTLGTGPMSDTPAKLRRYTFPMLYYYHRAENKQALAPHSQRKQQLLLARAPHSQRTQQLPVSRFRLRSALARDMTSLDLFPMAFKAATARADSTQPANLSSRHLKAIQAAVTVNFICGFNVYFTIIWCVSFHRDFKPLREVQDFNRKSYLSVASKETLNFLN